MRENLISVDEDGLLAAKQVIVEEFRFGVTVVAETHQMFLWNGKRWQRDLKLLLLLMLLWGL